jgi:hypothetical protein
MISLMSSTGSSGNVVIPETVTCVELVSVELRGCYKLHAPRQMLPSLRIIETSVAETCKSLVPGLLQGARRTGVEPAFKLFDKYTEKMARTSAGEETVRSEQQVFSSTTTSFKNAYSWLLTGWNSGLIPPCYS